MKKIFIITGGTAGHIIPSIEIGNKLIYLNWKVYWIIDKYSLIYFKKNKIFNKNIIIVNSINFRKLSFINKIFYIFKLFLLIIKINKIFNNIKPDLILGMGSYVSFPGCLLCWLKNIPLIIHEQNFIMGLSNKILSLFSKKILYGFNNIKYFKNKSVFVGNPIRDSLIKINNVHNIIKNRKNSLNILVLGGSQGSKFINDLIIKVLLNIKIDLKIWHQVGIKNYIDILNKYKKYMLMKYVYKIDKFVNNISKSFLWADLLISRSGALITSEILYIGLPSILIPFPHKDKHQYFNALELEKIGLSKIINQSKNSLEEILNYLNKINRKKLYNISIKSKINNNIINPTKEIINQIDEIYIKYKK